MRIHAQAVCPVCPLFVLLLLLPAVAIKLHSVHCLVPCALKIMFSIIIYRIFCSTIAAIAIAI